MLCGTSFQPDLQKLVIIFPPADECFSRPKELFKSIEACKVWYRWKILNNLDSVKDLKEEKYRK